MYEIILLSKAEKFYKKCNDIVAKRLNTCFERMENDPFTYDTVKPLKGEEFKDLYRIRVGNLRVIFKLDKENMKIYIIDISHRKGIYK